MTERITDTEQENSLIVKENPHTERCPLCQRKKLNQRVTELYLSYAKEKRILNLINKKLEKKFTVSSFRNHVAQIGLHVARMHQLPVLLDQILGQIDPDSLSQEEALEFLKLVFNKIPIKSSTPSAGGSSAIDVSILPTSELQAIIDKGNQ